MAFALLVRLAEQPPMEVNIFEDAECWIKIAAKALGHVGNPANLGVPVYLAGHIAAKHMDLALLNDSDACGEPEQRRLAGAVRPDQSDHPAGGNIDGNVIQRDRLAVTMGNALDLGHDVIRHWEASRQVFPARQRRDWCGRTPFREFRSSREYDI